MLIFQGLKEIGKFHTCVPACTGRKFRRALMDLLTAGAVYTSKLFYVGGDTSRTYLSHMYLTRIALHCGTVSSFDDLSVSTAVKRNSNDNGLSSTPDTHECLSWASVALSTKRQYTLYAIKIVASPLASIHPRECHSKIKCDQNATFSFRVYYTFTGILT